MPYQLVFTEPPAAVINRAVGENVFWNDLPADFKVYLFYYAGAMPDEAMEKKLRDLGSATGNNLFVNIGRLDDDQFDKISELFGIRKFPVIVITALGGLAGPEDDYLGAYARLDSEHLLGSPEKTVRCVQELFNLFMQGKVAEAVSQAKGRQRAEMIKWLAGFFKTALASLWDFVAERDISISLTEGKFELKRSGK
jgi:hypothetical protein